MPEHESWCCRSPRSVCATAGGCGGSCNCGAGARPGRRIAGLCRGDAAVVAGLSLGMLASFLLGIFGHGAVRVAGVAAYGFLAAVLVLWLLGRVRERERARRRQVPDA